MSASTPKIIEKFQEMMLNDRIVKVLEIVKAIPSSHGPEVLIFNCLFPRIGAAYAPKGTTSAIVSQIWGSVKCFSTALLTKLPFTLTHRRPVFEIFGFSARIFDEGGQGRCVSHQSHVIPPRHSEGRKD